MIATEHLKVKRPVLRYHGGKWVLAPWIISHFPKHEIYVEPFGGGASVLLRKTPVFSEIYNDLNDEIVNLFRVLRNRESFNELQTLVRLTPFSRREFEQSFDESEDKVEQARRTLVRFWFGISPAASALRKKTGFRTGIKQRFRAPSQDWSDFAEAISLISERLQSVTVDNAPAEKVMRQNDAPHTLFYLDPPYPRSTRSNGEKTNCYTLEMTDDEHRSMAAFVKTLTGMVIISGYACPLYDVELFPDWIRVERKAMADCGGERTEILWLSPNIKKTDTLL